MCKCNNCFWYRQDMETMRFLCVYSFVNKDKNTIRFSEKVNDFVCDKHKIKSHMIDNISDKAFAIANNALYFADSSDYKSALWEVCKVLNPNIKDDEIGSKYIEED